MLQRRGQEDLGLSKVHHFGEFVRLSQTDEKMCGSLHQTHLCVRPHTNNQSDEGKRPKQMDSGRRTQDSPVLRTDGRINRTVYSV